MSNIPFIMRGNHFLVHGHKKNLPHITCIFHLLKYVVKFCLMSAILHHISSLRLLPKSYFKISALAPLNYTWQFDTIHYSILFRKRHVVGCSKNDRMGPLYWLNLFMYFILTFKTQILICSFISFTSTAKSITIVQSLRQLITRTIKKKCAVVKLSPCVLSTGFKCINRKVL